MTKEPSFKSRECWDSIWWIKSRSKRKYVFEPRES